MHGGNAIITFFTPFDPAPCDKKSRSEHQTLFPLFGEGSGHETMGRGGMGTRRKRCYILVPNSSLVSFLSSPDWLCPDAAAGRCFKKQTSTTLPTISTWTMPLEGHSTTGLTPSQLRLQAYRWLGLQHIRAQTSIPSLYGIFLPHNKRHWIQRVFVQTIKMSSSPASGKLLQNFIIEVGRLNSCNVGARERGEG